MATTPDEVSVIRFEQAGKILSSGSRKMFRALPSRGDVIEVEGKKWSVAKTCWDLDQEPGAYVCELVPG